MEILCVGLGHWYTQKHDITLKQFDAGAVCFCRNETTNGVAHCSNIACPISSYHLSCLKLTGVSKKWMCPLCHKGSPPQKPQWTSVSDDTTKKAVKPDAAICVCNQKATASDKLIECHNNPCMNGKFFHLSCMNYKHKPNSAKTTWICPHCTTANHYNTKAKIKVTYGNSFKASTCKQCQHTQQWKFK